MSNKPLNNFAFRYADEDDTESIIELLKICLGEESVKKTPQYWKWKHIDNPFGKSYVLLAFDNDKLISIRAFMRWEWLKDGDVHNAVRAVDTVTHPEYRRRGLFKSLTYNLLDKMRTDGIDFVYNTPNDNSRPGNLKMGWKQFVKLRIKVNASVPLILRNRLVARSFDVNMIEDKHGIERLSSADLSGLLNSSRDMDLSKFKTNLSAAYIKWRYVDVPICRYGLVIGKQNHFFIFFRLKKRGPLRELRITDILVDSVSTKSVDRDIKKSIRELLYFYNADLATITGESGYIFEKRAKSWGFINVGRRGLIVTLNSLNLPFDKLMDSSLWAWNAGDLELF